MLAAQKPKGKSGKNPAAKRPKSGVKPKKGKAVLPQSLQPQVIDEGVIPPEQLQQILQLLQEQQIDLENLDPNILQQLLLAQQQQPVPHVLVSNGTTGNQRRQ